MKKGVMLICTILVVASFFIPWVSVEQGGMVKKITRMIKGEELNIPKLKVSGYDVPVMVNSEESRTIIALLKIFFPDVKDVDKKVYLIWVVPMLAVVLFLVSVFLGKNKIAQLAVGLLGILIFGVAYYKIATTSLDKAVLKVNIENGLWMVFLGYLGIGMTALLEFLSLSKK